MHGLGPDFTGEESWAVKHCPTTGPSGDHCQSASKSLSRDKNVLWIGSSSHIIARYYPTDRPNPLDFLCLSDKGQKPNDQVADPLTLDKCQAGDALEIGDSESLNSINHPR